MSSPEPTPVTGPSSLPSVDSSQVQTGGILAKSRWRSTRAGTRRGPGMGYPLPGQDGGAVPQDVVCPILGWGTTQPGQDDRGTPVWDTPGWTYKDIATVSLPGTKTDLSPTEWSFITYVMNMDVGISTFLDAVREGFASISSASPRNNAPVTSCPRVAIGTKHVWGTHGITGKLDEIKFFYRALSAAGQIVKNNQEVL